jgi:hypothetical protein
MICPCGKVGYDSRAEAERVIRNAGRAGTRAYQCESGPWHTTRNEMATHRRRRVRGRGLAPVRSLAEVQSIAEEMRARHAR